MLKLNDLNDKDRHAIEKIANRHFGNNYFDIENLKSSTENEFYIEYIKTTQIIGFILYGIDIGNRYNQFFMLNKHKTITINEKTGIIKTIAVAEEHQQHGYGRQLLSLAITNMQQLNVKQIIYIEWKESASHKALQKLLNKFNFILSVEIKDYWKEDSIQRKYHCPICGDPCRCTAQIFNKIIDES